MAEKVILDRSLSLFKQSGPKAGRSRKARVQLGTARIDGPARNVSVRLGTAQVFIKAPWRVFLSPPLIIIFVRSKTRFFSARAFGARLIIPAKKSLVKYVVVV